MAKPKRQMMIRIKSLKSTTKQYSSKKRIKNNNNPRSGKVGELIFDFKINFLFFIKLLIFSLQLIFRCFYKKMLIYFMNRYENIFCTFLPSTCISVYGFFFQVVVAELLFVVNFLGNFFFCF